MSPSSEIEAAFRHARAKVLSGVVARFGPSTLDLAEDACQNAMVKAWLSWPNNDVPRDPAAWLYRVAVRSALDDLRRRRGVPLSECLMEPTLAPSASVSDDDIEMLFLCTDLSLPGPSQTALVLKVVIGLGNGQIARALQTTPEAVEQRIARAKRAFGGIPQTSRVADEEKLPRILRVLYLTFNEGYATTSGDDLCDTAVCFEAVNLAQRLAERHGHPSLHSLLALMFFQASRLRAKTDAQGWFVPLADQDRGLWDHGMVRRGLEHLDRAVQSGDTSAYLHEAAIAACHACAPSFEKTDWTTILAAYDDLLRLEPTPVVALNRCVALTHAHGPGPALLVAKGVAADPCVASTPLALATLAYIYAMDGRKGEAAAHYRMAAERATNSVERRHFMAQAEVHGPAGAASG